MKIKLTPKTKWLIWASALSSALIVTYIILHASCQQGKVDLSLNKEQINAVNMILENDTIPERAQLTAFNYISNVLSLTDAKVLKRFFDTFQHKDIKAIIPEYAFEVKSYFWLKEPRVFLEIIFWSLFGLMANLMYSVNIAGVFEKKKIYEHIGKIFYTPASTIIIYLSLYALVNSGSISLNGVGKSVIVLSFILGFFTRRTIVLLGKIKDLVLPLGKDEPKKDYASDLEYSHADIAKLAIEQNQEYLKLKFPNIISISDAVHDMNKKETHVIAIYVEDSNTKGIPDTLEVKLTDGNIRTIATEIISDVGSGGLQCSQNDKIKTYNGDVAGSFCCLAKYKDKNLLVTAGHILSGLKSYNLGGWLYGDDSKDVLLNDNKKIGKWIFQQITDEQDIAFIELTDIHLNNDKLKRFANTGYYNVSDDSIKNEVVTLISNVGGEREGYLLDYNTVWSVPYDNETRLKWNIIIIGDSIVRNDSQSLSEKGDSGGLVFHKRTKKLIGLILGGNNKYTWVLPVQKTLEENELKLI